MNCTARPFILLVLTGILFFSNGCFTEIGNAEDERLLRTEFKIDYSENPVILGMGKYAAKSSKSDSILIQHFKMLVHEASYTLKDSVTHTTIQKLLWAEDSISDPVDFTGADKNANLKVEKLGSQVPENINLEFKVDEHRALNPTAMDFTGFSDIGYIKGVLSDVGNLKSTSGSTSSGTHFLFSLPTANEIHMTYSKTALLGWYKVKAYNCQIEFFPNKWIANVDFSKIDIVVDKNGLEFALIDSSHNVALYATLVASFYKSFNTLNVTE